MKYIDLFAGVGGFRYGIEKAFNNRSNLRNRNQNVSRNNTNTEESQIRATCVYSNEWDKYANSVYRKHFENCDNRDIREVKAEEIPDHDLLVGGFPCQAFSIAGKRRGFDETRGTLFFEIARILSVKQPRLFLLENVKGLLSHDKGRTFEIILAALDELGYDLQWQVLNSKNFGVPQNRERVFIVGHLRGTSRPEVFPILGTDKATGKSVEIIAHRKSYRRNTQVFSKDGITEAMDTGQGGGRGHYTAIPVLTPERPEKRQNGRRFKTDGEPSFTLTAQDKHGVFDGMKIRKLTPVECERLQGFPDNWTEFGDLYLDKKLMKMRNEIISDSQRYKMMGNAVTTNVVQSIIERMI